MKWFACASVLLLVAFFAAAALGSTATLTKAQYLAKLRAANATTAKVDNRASAAVGAKGSTPATVRALMTVETIPAERVTLRSTAEPKTADTETSSDQPTCVEMLR